MKSRILCMQQQTILRGQVRYTAKYNSTSTLKGLMVPTLDYPTRPADSNSTPQRTLCVHAASHVPSARMEPTS